MSYREAALSRMAELPWRVPVSLQPSGGETDRTASHTSELSRIIFSHGAPPPHDLRACQS
jgi:hypothetical protein